MSTDPTLTVEWTVPNDEWGGDAHDDDAGDVRQPPKDATESLTDRDPSELPPATVLAERVEQLRAEREAKQRQLDAVRQNYERLLDSKDAAYRQELDAERRDGAVENSIGVEELTASDNDDEDSAVRGRFRTILESIRS